MPGGVQQLVPQHVELVFQAGHHGQRDRDLLLPGRRQVRGRGRPHRVQAGGGADDLAQGGRALVEEDRVDPLHPGGVLAAQVMVGLQQRPGFQDLPGRDPALGQPALGQQLPQVPGVGLVGLGVPLAAAGERGVGRLGQVHPGPGRGHLLGDVPPPGAPLERERDVVAPGEPGQPRPQVLPVRGRDLPARHLPRHGVEVVEGQLLPVNIQPAYDGHRDLLKLPEGASGRPNANKPLRSYRHATELRRFRRVTAGAAGHASAPRPAPGPGQPMHVI